MIDSNCPKCNEHPDNQRIVGVFVLSKCENGHEWFINLRKLREKALLSLKRKDGSWVHYSIRRSLWFEREIEGTYFYV